VVQPQKADIATTEATRTGTGEETRASIETVLHGTAFHHHLAEAAMPTETETAKITALQATMVEAEVTAPSKEIIMEGLAAHLTEDDVRSLHPTQAKACLFLTSLVAFHMTVC
jgi:hypothetical protein